jgi:hypothetical protein
MKLLFSSLLLSFAAAEQQDRGLQLQYSNAGLLALRWDMTEPKINYDEDTDIFTFHFETASADNYNEGLEESFWNEDCMPAESGVTGYPIDVPLITSSTDDSVLPELVMGDIGSGDIRPKMTFKVDPAEFADLNVLNTYTTDPAGTATIKFCIRSSLGYTKNPGVDPLPDNYQEVNFIESIIEIEYNMAAGFSVDAFAVGPKDRILTTIEESYEDALLAYLCIGPQNPIYNSDTHTELIKLDNGVTYLTPLPLTEYNAALGTSAKRFNQGALINVCVRVKDEFATQDIVLKDLLTFSWTRSGGTTFDKSIGNGDGGNEIVQEAIVTDATTEKGKQAGNYLTSYVTGSCFNDYWCDFSSVLFAQFYNTDGTVAGSGDASLQFLETTRRLGEKAEQRRLQAEPGAAGLDLSIDVNGEVEGPGDLKTAGGASKATAFASAVALIGAALLA